MLAGLEEPDGGDIRIGGKSVVGLEPKDRDVALVFQSYALYPHLSARDNIGYPLKVRNLSQAGAADAGSSASPSCSAIGHLLPRRPAQLSGGEQQRVALARAIVREPRVFLMDEPLSNLDAKLRVHTRTELKTLQRELGTTMVFVTHDQAEAMSLADRIAVLSAGELQQIGTPDEVYDRPANVFVAEFIGSPPMNLLAGDARRRRGPRRRRRLADPAAVGRWRRVERRGRPSGCDRRASRSSTRDRTVTGGGGRRRAVRQRGHRRRPGSGVRPLKIRTAPDVRPAPAATIALRADPAAVRLFDRSTGAALS